jgi:hypothetical protein
MSLRSGERSHDEELSTRKTLVTTSGQETGSDRPAIPWILTTVSWSLIAGGSAFYFLQWYGTLGVLLVCIVLVLVANLTRARHPLVLWSAAGLLTGHAILIALGLIALARPG